MNHLWNLNLPWTWLNPPKGQMNPPSGNSIKAVQQIQIREPPRRGGSLIWYISQGDRTGAGVNEAPGAPQSRDPACAAAQVNSPHLHQKEIRLYGGFSFCISGELNPRALGNMPGACCNPRRPAPQRRSTPLISTKAR